MTVPPKNQPAQPGMDSMKTDEDFLSYDPRSSILSPAREYLEKQALFSNAKKKDLQPI
jgi:hypothetical protein